MGPSTLLALTAASPSPTGTPPVGAVEIPAWVVTLAGSAVVAAVVSGLVSVLLAWRASRLQERDRVRAAFAEAFRACAEYKEMPYAIARRRADQPAEERVRLSEELRGIQARMSYYHAWTRAECDHVGAAYDELVRQVRTDAGAAMRKGWNSPGLGDDRGMNVSPDTVNLAALAAPEQRFVAAAARHTRWAGATFRWHSRHCRTQPGPETTPPAAAS